MSKEKKFHQFIEELDQAKKERSWKKIQEQDTSNIESVQKVSFDSVKKRGAMVWKKALVTSFVAIIAIGTGVFGGIKLFEKDELAPTRYCDASMYTMQDVAITLKDRSVEEENLLFLNWYEITDFYMDQMYCLNDSQLEIGYYEQIADVHTGSLVEIHAIKKEYQLSELDVYEKMARLDVVEDIQVSWGGMDWFEYASFSFNGYNYYISLEYPMEEGSILNIVEEMLGQI